MTSVLERVGVRWLLASGVAAGLAGIILGETLLRPVHQVLYSGGLSMAHCAPGPARSACAFKYRVSVGNTGKEKQDSVRIQLPAELPRATVDIKVSDIVASASKTLQAQVRQESEPGGTAFVIRELEPNTIVDIELFCAQCERADLEALRGIRAKLEARGSAVEADPRASAFRHGLINVLRLLGLFR